MDGCWEGKGWDGMGREGKGKEGMGWGKKKVSGWWLVVGGG